MSITNEQAKQVKEQLLKQLNNLPEESRPQVKKQIDEMKNEEIEEFIKKNQLSHLDDNACVFCSIIEGNSPSIKIAENDDSIAVLDINPISHGHTLIIPKKHDSEPTKETQELAFKIGGKILEELKPNDITTRATKVMGHTILNVIPLYDNTDLEKKIKITPKELEEIAQKINLLKTLIKLDNTPKVEEVEMPISANKPISTSKEPICLFCSMANEETKSMKIDENKDNIAILEINPISKGHSLIIPKNHTETTKLPSNTFTLAKKIAKKIKTKYKPNDIKINPTSINNHALIELIPIYDKTDTSKRKTATEDELKKMQKDLSVKKRTIKSIQKEPKTKTSKKTIKIKKPKYPKLPQMPPRIP